MPTEQNSALNTASADCANGLQVDASGRRNSGSNKLSTRNPIHVLWGRLPRPLRNAILAALARLAFGFGKALLKVGKHRAGLGAALLHELLSVNPLKWAALIGSLSSFRHVQRVVGAVVPARFSAFPAGVLCSLGVLVMNRATRTELSLYLAVRAIHCLLVAYVWPRLPALLRSFEHYDTLTMMLAGGQIIYSHVMEPDTHSAFYRAFLLSCAQQKSENPACICAAYRGHVVPQMVKYCMRRGLPLPTHPPSRSVCQFVHPQTITCNERLLYWTVSHLFQFSLPLYAPLKILTTCLFSWRTVREDPLSAAYKAIKSTISSSLFLTLYCALPFRAMCWFGNHNVHNEAIIASTFGFLCGLPTLLEPKSRRIDLALYCSMHALRAAVLLLVKRGWFARPGHVFRLVVFLLSFGYIFHQYDHAPESLHRNVRKSLNWMVATERAPAVASPDARQATCE